MHPVYIAYVSCRMDGSRLQVIQSECLRAIGNHPRRTPHFPPSQLSKHPANPRSHPPPYWQIFRSLPLTPQNPPVQQIGTYTLADLTDSYKNYKRKRTALICLPEVAVFFVHNFSLPLFAPIFIYIRESYRKSWATIFCMRTGNSRRRRVLS